MFTPSPPLGYDVGETGQSHGGCQMEIDKKTIAGLLELSEKKTLLDKCIYISEFPDEIKAWKHIGQKDPDLRRYHQKSYYPADALIALIDRSTELLVKKRFPTLQEFSGTVITETRFRKLVVPENTLLIKVKLLRTYKGKLAVFSSVIADRDGDIVAENFSKGAVLPI